MKEKKKASFLTPLAAVCMCIFFISVNLCTVKAAAGISVDTHSQQDIKKMYQQLDPQPQSTEYERKPGTKAPYSLGKVSDRTLQNGLNTLNFMRYVAGIPYDVTIKEEYQELAQAGALVNYANGGLSHSPGKPSGMDDSLYSLGYKGAGSSNIGWGYTTLYSAIVNGWMEDGDPSNIDRVGHRRWCLNPTMQQTGFGIVGNYYSMYAFDRTFEPTEYYGVAWPAQNMPYEFFSSYYPWSISMGKTVDASSVQVTLKHNNTGKTWKFSSSSADGDFYVNNDNYGQKGCIIFRPKNIKEYVPGDSFQVTITGSGLNVSYSVNFFKAHEHTGGTATCCEKAVCSICREEYGGYGDHVWAYRKDTEGRHYKYCTAFSCNAHKYESCTYKDGICTKCGGIKKLDRPKLKSVSPAGYRTVKITWGKVAGASSYTLYYRKVGDTKWRLVKEDIKGTSYTHATSKIAPLYLGKKYTYMVKAVHSGAASEASNASAAIAPRIPKPTITKISKNSNGVQLTWKTVKGAAAYQIQRYQGGKWVTAGETKKTTYLDRGAKKKGTYQYRVRSCRGAYYSAWSGIKTITR